MPGYTRACIRGGRRASRSLVNAAIRKCFVQAEPKDKQAWLKTRHRVPTFFAAVRRAQLGRRMSNAATLISAMGELRVLKVTDYG